MELNTALLIILIAVVLFKDYVTSFFKEKGKNAATKQDITDITKQIEAVKHEFVTAGKEARLSIQGKISVSFKL